MVGKISKIEKAIIGEIQGSSEAMDNLIVLCDEFGGRLAGSENNKGAAEFILSKYEEYGFENPHLESFKFPGTEAILGRLEIVDPVKREIPCICLPRTVSGDVEADVVYLGHGERLEEQLDDLEGKIILTSDRGPIIRSVMAGAVGVIWMRPFPMMGQTTGGIPSVLPSVGIKYEDGMMLNRFILRKGKVRVRIETQCEHFERESWNVCGEIPGNGTSDEFIMFGGHHDGHEIAQAAFDCGAPCMASLEIGRVLNKFREHLDRNIRIVLFSAEEYGCWGSKDYAKKHSEDMKKMRFTYQFDSCAAGSTQVLTIDYWPELVPFFDKLREDLNIEMPLRQRKGPGDSEAFFKLGIPTGCVREGRRFDYPGSLGGLSTVWHTYYDTVDKIDIRSLREVITIGAISGYRMVNAIDWPKHRTPEEIEKTPIMQNMREAQKLNKKLKKYLMSKQDKLRPETKEYMKRL
jgi:Iap family predicted aminopeptidase